MKSTLIAIFIFILSTLALTGLYSKLYNLPSNTDFFLTLLQFLTTIYVMSQEIVKMDIILVMQQQIRIMIVNQNAKPWKIATTSPIMILTIFVSCNTIALILIPPTVLNALLVRGIAQFVVSLESVKEILWVKLCLIQKRIAKGNVLMILVVFGTLLTLP